MNARYKKNLKARKLFWKNHTMQNGILVSNNTASATSPTGPIPKPPPKKTRSWFLKSKTDTLAQRYILSTSPHHGKDKRYLSTSPIRNPFSFSPSPERRISRSVPILPTPIIKEFIPSKEYLRKLEKLKQPKETRTKSRYISTIQQNSSQGPKKIWVPKSL